MSVLAVDFITQSSVKQRRGRAGRTQPGVCHHLYTQVDVENMEESQAAELLRCNLALAYLRLKDLGVLRVADFPFIEAPQPEAMEQARELLNLLGALQLKGRDELLTEPIGRRMARLQTLDPMLARSVHPPLASLAP